jgi:DNA-binding transcriptional MerR regulator/GGDEF domain-containing protein
MSSLSYSHEEREMDERNAQQITEHFQKSEVQERIRQSFQKIRQDANVTISVVKALTGLTENKLRYLEKLELFKPARTNMSKGHRLYSFQELDKLILIAELLNADFSPGDIPGNIDTLWYSITAQASEPQHLQNEKEHRDDGQSAAIISVNQRRDDGRAGLFWQYFVSSVLHTSLLLISKDLLRTTIGLILPLSTSTLPGSVKQMDALPDLGTALIAWLGKSHSSQTLLTERIEFEYATDFRLLPLTVMTEDQLEEAPSDQTLIFLQRRARRLTLNAEVVTVIRRLLSPIYEDIQQTCACFENGMRDAYISSADLEQDNDLLLYGLLEMITRLGGRTAEGKPRWRFCCMLMPQDAMSPLHQKSLIIRVQSKYSPHKVGETIVTPNDASSSLSIRALQSGHIVYHPRLPQSNTTIPFARKDEGAVRSAIALPIGGENGLGIAVLYVASDELAAFSQNDQRLLRIICLMIEELLKTYQLRQQATKKLTKIIDKPELVDLLFQYFPSENNFASRVDAILTRIQEENYRSTMSDGRDTLLQGKALECISFIGIDIDKHSSLTNKYGELVTRNLSYEVGLHIQELLRVAFKEYPQCQMYYMFADRFYILLENITRDQACMMADKLRESLAGSHKVDALRISTDDLQRSESMLELSNITVRVGVTSYPFDKLKEILNQYTDDDAVSEVRTIIHAALEKALEIGRDKGGNITIAWNNEKRVFETYVPPLHNYV